MKKNYTINLSWPTRKECCVEQYFQWLELCLNKNITIVRIFLVPWGIYPYGYTKDMDYLLSIISKANELGIKVVLVLDTYVNYCSRTFRDFENCEYCWDTNMFSNNQSIGNFLEKRGVTEYLDRIIEILNSIIEFENIIYIELCNEIDLINAKKKSIIAWINNSIKELTDIFGNRFLYGVSISDYRRYKVFSDNLLCRCDIHSYRFPYNTALENYEYYSRNFPKTWLSEFSCFSDFAHSDTIESKTYFVGMIASALFNNATIMPATWWWAEILNSPQYVDLFSSMDSINTLGFDKLDEKIAVEVCGQVKLYDRQTKEKIRYRLGVLKKNLGFIVDEMPAITKFIKKSIFRKYNNQFAYQIFVDDRKGVHILVETYTHIRISLANLIKNEKYNIVCANLIDNTETIYNDLRVLLEIATGVYWINIDVL